MILFTSTAVKPIVKLVFFLCVCQQMLDVWQMFDREPSCCNDAAKPSASALLRTKNTMYIRVLFLYVPVVRPDLYRVHNQTCSRLPFWLQSPPISSLQFFSLQWSPPPIPSRIEFSQCQDVFSHTMILAHAWSASLIDRVYFYLHVNLFSYFLLSM